jgi:hypothetical protein
MGHPVVMTEQPDKTADLRGQIFLAQLITDNGAKTFVLGSLVLYML